MFQLLLVSLTEGQWQAASIYTPKAVFIIKWSSSFKNQTLISRKSTQIVKKKKKKTGE